MSNQAPQNRSPRDVETRAAVAREETWAPPDLLPEPEKTPGYVYRWVRTATNGVDDPMNMSRQMREGYAIVTPEEQPKLVQFADPRAAQKGSIEYGGLILMKAPETMMRQRQAYYDGRTRQEQQAVDQELMKQNDARMPLISQRKTKVTFGSGGA